jgi:hypothetical protein
VINVILIAVAGFVVMLACSMWAVTSSRRMTGTTGRVPSKDRRSGKKRRAAKARRSGKQAGSGLMGRLEEPGGMATGRPLIPGCPLPSSRRGHAAVIIAC